jgi:putative ABC transport system substrate-binding protein
VAAAKLGVELQTFGVRAPDEFDRTFAAITSARAASLLVLPDPLFSAYTTRIADLADKNRLPAMYGLREDVVAGGLLAYGPKVLKGAKPADLPVEQPTKFELVINLKTARTLGLTVPPALLALADEVIE